MAVTGRLALVALLGVVPLALAPHVLTFLVVLFVLIACLVIDLVLAASPRRVLSQRTPTGPTRLGQTTTSHLVLINGSKRTLRASLRDAWQPSAGASDNRAHLRLAAGERRAIDVRLTPTRRGERHTDRLTIRSLGPLGTAARQHSFAVPGVVRVLPAFASVRHLPSRLARLRDLEGRTLTMTRGQGTEFDSLREYVIGDDVRSIDWRASARVADVVVRTWRPERDRHVVLVLDSGRTSAGRVGDSPRLDAAMDASMLLTALAARAGDHVHLFVGDAGLRALVRDTDLTELANTLSDIEPALVETDWSALVRQVLTRIKQRSLVVLLTPLEPAVIQAGLLPDLAQLTRHHRVIVASVADPALERITTARGSTEAVYGAAAASAATSERAALARRLAARGVSVVDEPPDTIAPRLADTYIDLKALGQI